MTYLPQTTADVTAMLKTIGVTSIDELFAAVPSQIVNPKMPVQPALNEIELRREFKRLAKKNITGEISFLGAGSYRHHIPAAIDALASRSEFYTAYTPYQPEISQGTLTAIFEFQSLMCKLTGLDISNASLYDGGSATAEAAMLAINYTKRKKIVLANRLNPNYLQVLKTYITPQGGLVADSLSEIDEQTAAVVFAVPDYYGVVSEYTDVIASAKAKGALVVIVADPLLLSAVTAPGKLGADIVVGEAQPLGIPQSFGGPGLGFMTIKKELLRYLPGRVVGQTVDRDGRQAFVLTMQTREQHIKREKATSNICSNQALCALRATIYLVLMGRNGLQQTVKQINKLVDYAQTKISKLPGYSVDLTKKYFREFTVTTSQPVKKINQKLLEKNIIGGLELAENKMLLAVTEVVTCQQIDELVELLHG